MTRRRGFIAALLGLAAAPHALTAEPPGFVSGGIVTGPVLATVHPGEFVLQIDGRQLDTYISETMRKRSLRITPKPVIGNCNNCHVFDPDGPPGAR